MVKSRRWNSNHSNVSIFYGKRRNSLLDRKLRKIFDDIWNRMNVVGGGGGEVERGGMGVGWVRQKRESPEFVWYLEILEFSVDDPRINHKMSLLSDISL